MTDNEIIKVLDSVGTATGIALGHHSGQADIIADRFRELIEENNSQKAEIERLKGSIITNNSMTIQRIKRKVKSEAIKEFMDEFKTKATVVHKSYSGIHYYETDDNEIDNLVKEKTEIKENDRA